MRTRNDRSGLGPRLGPNAHLLPVFQSTLGPPADGCGNTIQASGARDCGHLEDVAHRQAAVPMPERSGTVAGGPPRRTIR